MKLYCLFDAVANTFYSPSAFQSDAIAKRSFGDLITSERYNRTKGDYALYYVGDFDSDSGSIVSCSAPVIICKGSDFIADNS